MLTSSRMRRPTQALGRTFQLQLRASSDIAQLESLLQAAKDRATKGQAPSTPPPMEDLDRSKMFQVQGFNSISPVGLDRFLETGRYMLTGSAGTIPDGVKDEPHALMLRSHNLKPEEVPETVRAIARCGAGTNNIPVDTMTDRGIPVFNTPGANANSVKELVLCGLLLASRGIVEGIAHTKNKIVPEEKGDHKAIAARIEKDKKMFVGHELAGRTLAICGLGHIGCTVAETALSLGMKVVGYDPGISVEAAWRLPREVHKAASLADAFSKADYVSVHMPYIKSMTHHAIDTEVLKHMKKNAHLLNFSRAEIVDGGALRRLYDHEGHTGKYICDFADEDLQDHKQFMCIPHLGASTAEAEDNCAKMAADQLIDFIESGNVVNSVNFPTAILERQDATTTRLVIINKNVPGVLGHITTLLGNAGVNISQQLNTSRDQIAYNVIDMHNFPQGPEADQLQLSLGRLEAVISTRLIFKPSASEGPASFYNKKLLIQSAILDPHIHRFAF